MATKKIIKRVAGKRVPAPVRGKEKEKISSVKAALIRKKILLLDSQFAKLNAIDAVTKKTLTKGKETIKNKLPSLSELSEMESLQLQMVMERLSQMMTTLSNILKKISDNASEIIKNLK